MTANGIMRGALGIALVFGLPLACCLLALVAEGDGAWRVWWRDHSDPFRSMVMLYGSVSGLALAVASVAWVVSW